MKSLKFKTIDVRYEVLATRIDPQMPGFGEVSQYVALEVPVDPYGELVWESAKVIMEGRPVGMYDNLDGNSLSAYLDLSEDEADLVREKALEMAQQYYNDPSQLMSYTSYEDIND